MAAAETSAAGRDTVPRLLAHNAKHYADKPAYREKEFGIWQSWSWAEAASEVNKLALGLLDLGLALVIMWHYWGVTGLIFIGR